jgi:RNA polymerase sigma-70 factor (ECF subfamily)
MVMSGEEVAPNLPEDSLITRAVAGDKDALVVLLYRYYDVLAADLRQKLPAEGRAVIAVEDVLQQSFIKAFQHIGSFEKRGRHGFYYWLKTITDHTCIDELRKSRQRRECEAPWSVPGAAGNPSDSSGPQSPEPRAADAETPSHTASRHEAAGALQAALNTLQPRQREAVCLVFLQDLSLDEAATRMSTTKAAVHSLVYRGLEKLEEALGPMSDYLSRK